MSDMPPSTSALPTPPAASAGSLPSGASASGTSYVALTLATLLALGGLASSALLWQKLNHIQEQLARQSADSGALADQAQATAREAQDLARDAAARLTVAETRLGEVALQRTQLEELMQSLSRSRDETLVVDIESALRLAQQQAELAGNLQPLVVALKSAQQRIERAAQPRLTPVQRAIERDLEVLARTHVTDTAGLLARLDELVRLVDDLPTLNAVAQAATMRRPGSADAPAPAAAAPAEPPPWWQPALQRAWEALRDEARGLLRISRIDQPDALLLAPDQAFFLRENLKLKLLNARLAVLARQTEAARSDLGNATAALNKYFDPASRRTQNAATLLQQIQAHMKNNEAPRLDDTLAALATAAAGR